MGSAPWNILVTGREGVAADLLRELKHLGRFRWSPFRNVILGEVDEPEAFLAALYERIEAKPFVRTWLGKVLPIEVTFDVDAERFLDDAARQLSAFLDRIARHSFYVRVERRGHKGRLHTHEIEQELGGRLVQQLEARGLTPVVKFDDPDLVLVVEIVGNRAGIAAIGRELRQRYPAVRVR